MQDQQQLTFGLPKPGRALIGAMVVVFAIWLLFAIGLNWGGASEELFHLFTGSNLVFEGQVWRLFTSFLIHQPVRDGSVGHLLTTLFGLYFLGTSLEERLGQRKFILFLLGAGVFAATLQLLVTTVVPRIAQPEYFGALGVIDAIAIAWALSFRGQQVRLFFVLPVSGTGMMIFIFVMNVLYVVAMEQRRDGLVTPFGGMLAGFLFAPGSPVRQAYLKWRLGRLQAQSVALGGSGKARPAHLTVIRGGRDEKPDKSMLN